MNTPEDYPKSEITEQFEQALAQSQEQQYILRLYIAGTTFHSMTALQNLKNICEEYLQGRYQLEVIDIYQDPQIMMTDNIVAIPTLIKQLPLPLQKLIGDLSDQQKVLVGLDLIPQSLSEEE